MHINTVADTIKGHFNKDVLGVEVIGPKRLIVAINPKSLPEIANYLFEEMTYRFIIASALLVDQAIEIYYHFSDDTNGYIVNLDVMLPREKPEIESLANIIYAADWIEREIHDLYGVTFLNHPNPVPFIAHENWKEGAFPYSKTKENV